LSFSRAHSNGLFELDPAFDWNRIANHYGPWMVAITDDGRFINNSLGSFRPYQMISPISWHATDFFTDWAAVGMVNDYNAIAMKTDGSLWFAGAGDDAPWFRDHVRRILPGRFRPRYIGQLPERFFD